MLSAAGHIYSDIFHKMLPHFGMKTCSSLSEHSRLDFSDFVTFVARSAEITICCELREVPRGCLMQVRGDYQAAPAIQRSG